MSGVGSDPLIGRRVGSYVVEQKLGEGGMGAVYRAVQPEIGKRVAVKFLAPALSSDPALVARFFAEARAVNLIQHENIVDIFDFQEHGGTSYFVMELLTGHSLAEVLGALGRLPIERALAVAVQVAAAIAAAHAHTIVHRDLKPDNIFLTTKAGYADFVKVLDFGIAKLQRDGEGGAAHTLRGMVMGTPGFMSPEQGTGGNVDGRTDIYALGVMLYRMIAGKLPFLGDSFDEILQKQLSARLQPLSSERPETPPAVDALVKEMLARDPGRRPQTMREVQERLVALLASAQPGSGPHPISGGWRSVPPTRLPSGSRRKTASRSSWRGAALGGALALVGVAALGVSYLRRQAEIAPNAIVSSHLPAIQLAPQVAPAVTSAPASTAVSPPPASGDFSVFLETRPAGAEIRSGARLLGITPARVTLSNDERLRLHTAGYRDEELPVTRGTEHVIVPLERAASVARPSRPTVKPAIPAPPPPAASGSGLGLND